MRKAFLISAILCALSTPVLAKNKVDAVVKAAHERTQFSIRYDPKYVGIAYPGGDVPSYTGVCTDVIIRTYRAALEFDFQKAVHEDMKANFSAYPTNWGHKRPDTNIDHRRVPNLERYLERQGASLNLSKNPADYRAGDIVSWRLTGGLPHIGIVSDNKTARGIPLIIHNIGLGPVEENILFAYDIHGHFRYFPEPDN